MNITELPTSGEEQGTPAVTSSHPGSSEVTPAQVLIHTNDALDESAAQEIIHTLNQTKGVSGTRFNPDKEHLIMVSYDPHAAEAMQLLAAVHALGHEAQLIGL